MDKSVKLLNGFFKRIQLSYSKYKYDKNLRNIDKYYQNWDQVKWKYRGSKILFLVSFFLVGRLYIYYKYNSKLQISDNNLHSYISKLANDSQFLEKTFLDQDNKIRLNNKNLYNLFSSIYTLLFNQNIQDFIEVIDTSKIPNTENRNFFRKVLSTKVRKSRIIFLDSDLNDLKWPELLFVCIYKSIELHKIDEINNRLYSAFRNFIEACFKSNSSKKRGEYNEDLISVIRDIEHFKGEFFLATFNNSFIQENFNEALKDFRNELEDIIIEERIEITKMATQNFIKFIETASNPEMSHSVEDLLKNSKFKNLGNNFIYLNDDELENHINDVVLSPSRISQYTTEKEKNENVEFSIEQIRKIVKDIMDFTKKA